MPPTHRPTRRSRPWETQPPRPADAQRPLLDDVSASRSLALAFSLWIERSTRRLCSRVHSCDRACSFHAPSLSAHFSRVCRNKYHCWPVSASAIFTHRTWLRTSLVRRKGYIDPSPGVHTWSRSKQACSLHERRWFAVVPSSSNLRAVDRRYVGQARGGIECAGREQWPLQSRCVLILVSVGIR